MKPGRNSPCPCGSGRKYKKCCLPRHESERREIEQLELAEWETGAPAEWLQHDDDDDDLDQDIEPADYEFPPLDPAEIRRIRHASGFVERLDDAFDGQGLEVSVWTAPNIPQEILDAVAREGIGELDGSWGDSRAGSPVQVDTIEIETYGDHFVNVEVFNRAIALAAADSEELRRLHRVLEVLQEACGSRRIEGVSAAARIVQQTLPPPLVELDDALKRHRHQGGACELCGEPLKRTTAARHYATCAPAHDVQKAPIQDLVQLRITPPPIAGYWLDAEARADATLESLDNFLRRTWLECCGHLSKFAVGNVDYFSRGYQLNAWGRTGLAFGSSRVERAMNARLGTALPPIGGTFAYEYDFGSTTRLVIKVTGTREGRIGRAAIRTLGRNSPLVWPCAHCGEPASLVCATCLYDDTNPFVCEAHAGGVHRCGEDAYLPVVNSPRMGVCGYAG